MDLKNALLLIADWIEEGLETERLDHYYWGYMDAPGELRKAADELG